MSQQDNRAEPLLLEPTNPLKTNPLAGRLRELSELPAPEGAGAGMGAHDLKVLRLHQEALRRQGEVFADKQRDIAMNRGRSGRLFGPTVQDMP